MFHLCLLLNICSSACTFFCTDDKTLLLLWNSRAGRSNIFCNTDAWWWHKSCQSYPVWTYSHSQWLVNFILASLIAQPLQGQLLNALQRKCKYNSLNLLSNICSDNVPHYGNPILKIGMAIYQNNDAVAIGAVGIQYVRQDFTRSIDTYRHGDSAW